MALKEYGKDFFDFNSFAANAKPGDTVYGIPYNFVDFGVFVALDNEGKFSGLIPSRFISKKGEQPVTAIPHGQRQEFRIQQIDKVKQRITLSTLEYDFGERKARPKDTTDYNEPINNSKVVVGEGDKEITITLPDANDEKTKISRTILTNSIKVMANDSQIIDSYYSDKPDHLECAEDIIENSFSEGMPTHVFLRNLTYENKEREILRLGLRLARQEGDYWHDTLGLPMSQTFLFEGRLNDHGREFVIDKILVVGNSEEALAYEVSLEIIQSTGRNRSDFMYNILNQMTSFTKYTSKKLTLWSDYLNWCEKVAKLQIQGVKYVGVSFDRTQKQLVFELLFSNEDEYKRMQRILKRQEIEVFPNKISTDRLAFKYNTGDGKRYQWIKGTNIGNSMGIVGNSYGIDIAPRKLDMPVSEKDNDEKTLTLSLIHDKFTKPFFVSWGFGLNDDDLEKIDSMDGDISDLNDHSFDDLINEILSQYPKDGFLALSAIGDLALINRFRRAIDQIRNGESYNPHLEEWLFDISQVRKPDKRFKVSISRWLDDNVASNENQREAIEKMLRTKDLFLLQGPPGTGKTTVIAEAIFQFAIRGERVLLSSQSNDAVDNALERLVKTPEIRAIRLMNSKNRRFLRDDEESVNNLSENTALRFYYESLSDKISKQTLDKWNNLQNKINDCQVDLRNVKAIGQTIATDSQDRENKQNELQDLNTKLEETQQKLTKIQKANEAATIEKNNLDEFKKVIAGEETDFALLEKQLDIIFRLGSSANDSDYNLWNIPSATLTTTQRNTYLKLFINNVVQLKRLNKKIADSINTAIVDDDLELKHLNAQAGKLQEQMDSVTNDEEYDRLEKELNALKREIRKRRQQSQGVDCNLNETQKQIISQQLQNLLTTDKKKFIDSLTAKNHNLDGLLFNMTEALERYQASLQIQDENPITNTIDVINGKINAANDSINTLTQHIHSKQEDINRIAKKYSIEPTNDIDSIVQPIAEYSKKLEKDLKKDSVMRENFGALLEDFRRTLKEHISNRRLLENDNEHYLSTYINSCNVVGFSCTADPRILTEKDIHNFDVVIIDEVSKATPPELLLPLMKAQKVILVGDHRQLPPMFKTNERSYEEIISDIAESDDYTAEEKEAMSMDNFKRYKMMVTSSLFKDYFERAPEEIKSSLLTQYRMHKDIMNIINRFYDGKLICGIPEANMESRKAHHLTINNCRNKPFVTPEKHAFWIDSSTLPNDTPIYESFIGSSSSACNFLEENIVIALLRKINDAYVKLGYGKDKKVTVGVISFYQAAVNNMRRKIKQARSRSGFNALEISTNTVDRFQGQEKNIIIASLVRSKEPKGPNGKVLLSKHVLAFERINVAFSRAQNLLFIVGAKKSFENLEVTLPLMDKQETRTIPVYKNIMQDLHRKGCLVDSSCVIDEHLAQKTLDEFNKNKKRGNGKFNKNEKKARS